MFHSDFSFSRKIVIHAVIPPFSFDLLARAKRGVKSVQNQTHTF
jgi:hypothetical protein